MAIARMLIANDIISGMIHFERKNDYLSFDLHLKPYRGQFAWALRWIEIVAVEIAQRDDLNQRIINRLWNKDTNNKQWKYKQYRWRETIGPRCWERRNRTEECWWSSWWSMFAINFIDNFESRKLMKVNGEKKVWDDPKRQSLAVNKGVTTKSRLFPHKWVSSLRMANMLSLVPLTNTSSQQFGSCGYFLNISQDEHPSK